MMPNDLCTKKEIPFIQVLREKHLDMRVPDLNSEDCIAFEQYPCCPDPIPVMCDEDSMESIANKLGGAVGPNSVDAATAKALMLNYGDASAELREEMLWWAEWMCNTSPLWA